MTIREAINALIDMEKGYGSGILVYFDCPKCNSTYIPDFLGTKTQAIIIKNRDKNANKS